MEEEFPIEADAGAFSVLKKILFDGYIKASWVIRKNHPTVFGPIPVVCCTAMPLSAFLMYVKQRENPDYVNEYGIAFLRNEFYRARGRPVIYGLSGKYSEAKEGDPYYGCGLRTLASSCGIGVNEQYRFVPLELDKKLPIDYSHEREWRWGYDFKKHECPGLPIWLRDDFIEFSKIIVIVSETEEANEFVDKLKDYYDSGGNIYDIPFNEKTLENTFVLAIEDIKESNTDLKYLRIEDLPFKKLPTISPKEPSQECIELVNKAIKEAMKASKEAAEKSLAQIPKDHKGRPLSLWGFADVVTYESHTEVTEALLQLGYARSIGGIGYLVYQATDGADTQGIIDIEKAAARAAAEKLTKILNQEFYIRSRLD